MTPFAQYVLTAALILTIVAVVGNLIVLTAKKKTAVVRPQKVLVGANVAEDEGPSLDTGDDESTVSEDDASDIADTMEDEDAELVHATKPTKGSGSRSSGSTSATTTSGGVGLYSTVFTVIAFLLVTLYLTWRMIESGHGPFTNQHEFAVAFTWGIIGAYIIVQWRFKLRMLSMIMLPVAACLLIYAMNLDASIGPLVPALQNSVLLTLHVGFAILSYGAACVSFGAAVIYLLYPRIGKNWKTSQDRFDEIGYKGAVIAFPLMTIMIVLGALWADTAWGSYWSWDPKETAALVTWLLYAAFLHARVMRGWRGKRSAWFLIIGFAAVLFAYFGNHFFGGLHSYG